MLNRSSLGAVLVLAALCVATADCQAWDDSKYRDFSRQWRPIGGPGRFDMSKPAGRAQGVPYQAIFEANLRPRADKARPRGIMRLIRHASGDEGVQRDGVCRDTGDNLHSHPPHRR
jgi:hypothetical protein